MEYPRFRRILSAAPRANLTIASVERGDIRERKSRLVVRTARSAVGYDHAVGMTTSGMVALLIPYLLRKHGVPVDRIAEVVAAASCREEGANSSFFGYGGVMESIYDNAWLSYIDA